MFSSPFQNKDRLLVIGERIVDSEQENHGDGSAWVNRMRDMLIAHEPEKSIELIDRTNWNATVHSLRQRWDDDVLWFKPQWLIIHPGPSDLWRTKDQAPEHMDAEALEQCLVELIERTRQSVPDCRFALVDPILLYDNADPAWYSGQILKLHPGFRAAIKQAAVRTNATYVPAQDAFTERLNAEGENCFGPEDNNPDQDGHILLAHTVLKACGATLPKSLPLKHNQSVVFIGDSITDAARRGLRYRPFGCGYMRLWRALLLARDPVLARSFKFVNRGIGGQTIRNLAFRWERDCLAHAPDHLVIKIGINDINRWLSDTPDAVTVEDYATILDELLTRTRAKNPAIKITLLSPFYVSRDSYDKSYRSRVNHHLPDYIHAMQRAAAKHNATFVDLHAAFQKHLDHRHGSTFTGKDGVDVVHPSETGCMVIAEALYAAMG